MQQKGLTEPVKLSYASPLPEMVPALTRENIVALQLAIAQEVTLRNIRKGGWANTIFGVCWCVTAYLLFHRDGLNGMGRILPGMLLLAILRVRGTPHCLAGRLARRFQACVECGGDLGRDRSSGSWSADFRRRFPNLKIVTVVALLQLLREQHSSN